MSHYLVLILLGLSVPVATAQPLRQLPNTDFSRWNGPEPTGWQTNNLYDDQGKLQQAIVVPVGTAGVKLLAKRVVYRAEEPAIEAWYGGQLSSVLIPYMPAEGKPLILTVHYRFRPDSADVLRADVQLSSRDNLGNSITPDPACVCRFSGITGPITLSPDKTAVTFQASFADPASPDRVPRGCAVYVWKIRFWLENRVTHPHEGTEAVIEQIALPQ